MVLFAHGSESVLSSQRGSPATWSSVQVPTSHLAHPPSSYVRPRAFPGIVSPQPAQRSLVVYSRRQQQPRVSDSLSSDSLQLSQPAGSVAQRPLRYRCQSDTVALDSRSQSELSDTEVASTRAFPFHELRSSPQGRPLSVSSPASCGAHRTASHVPARLHFPSLASETFPENSDRSAAPSGSEDLDLTRDISGDRFSSTVSEASFAPQPQAPQEKAAAASPTFSPASLSLILAAAASFQKPSKPPSTRAKLPAPAPPPPARVTSRLLAPPMTPMKAAGPAHGVSAIPGVRAPSVPAHITPSAPGIGGTEGPLIHHGIAGSGIVVAPPTPRSGPSPMGAPPTNNHLLPPQAPRTGPPVETSSTHDRQWVAVTAYRPVDVVTKTVEVPVTRTVDVLVPRPVIQEKIVEVPKFVPHYVEKILEVPEIEWVDRVIEVPEYFYSTKYVPKVEIRENIIERPLYQDKWVEKIVEVPRVEEIVRYRDIVEAEEVIKYIPKGHSEEEWRGAPIFSVPPEHAPPLPPKWVSPGVAPGRIQGYCPPEDCFVAADGSAKGRTKLVEHTSPAFLSPPVNGVCHAGPFWTVDCRNGGE
ncbi:UNVERIFIED_CONTAM: alveolin domain containing intermediate filament IMC5 [Hammondia hammondi]|eukprot:XP_008881828.1 alveolin domain containing intermediate filament IMC5 [Hammondia hammondi]